MILFFLQEATREASISDRHDWKEITATSTSTHNQRSFHRCLSYRFRFLYDLDVNRSP
ncbi:hypothetical protein LSTR_LSTR000061 [Laodelphax striatellus]|uniref:Uncharacterized protein n=1 Tax=Laodelphax striatellus TaxID=195883 RepID=A0A482X6F5_LAOST|nr:hypothetical protein LSTR_LSTR000061 [Laodelphax striatellus]